MSVLSFFGVRPNGIGTPPVAKDPPAEPPRDEKEAVSRETGIVLDALSSILQYYGKFAFDTDTRSGDEIRRLLHGWMLHASMGSPRPDHADDRPSAGVFYRDWKGLVQVFGEARRDESKYAVHALEDLRSVVWAFVSAVHQVVVEEQEESRVASDHLHRMRLAVESNSTELIKREALAVVTVIEQLVVHRKERQRAQFTALAGKLKRLGRELEDARREGTLDALTGLANRKAFDEYITRSIELHSLLGQPACLMMIDVDSFKQINDSFGHITGDTILRQVSNILSKTFLRRVDFVCRYGGDEFAVILQETKLENAQLLAERLRRQVQDVRVTDGAAREEVRAGEKPGGESESVEAPRVTLSIGVAELSVGDDSVAWIKRADGALYHSKRSGRDTVSAAVS